jgi:hypothetical protein
MSSFLYSCLACGICLGVATDTPLNADNGRDSALPFCEECPIARAVGERIQTGMTEEQVETLLGRPPDRQYEGNRLESVAGAGIVCVPYWMLIWRGERGNVEVHLKFRGRNKGRRVTHVKFVDDKMNTHVLAMEE